MDDYSALLKLNDSEDVIHISGRLRDVSGLTVGTPIRNVTSTTWIWRPILIPG